MLQYGLSALGFPGHMNSRLSIPGGFVSKAVPKTWFGQLHAWCARSQTCCCSLRVRVLCGCNHSPCSQYECGMDHPCSQYECGMKPLDVFVDEVAGPARSTIQQIASAATCCGPSLRRRHLALASAIPLRCDVRSTDRREERQETKQDCAGSDFVCCVLHVLSK